MERRMSIIARSTNKYFPVHIAYISSGPNAFDIKLGNVILHKINASSNYDPFIILRVIHLILFLRPLAIQTWSIQMDVLGGVLCWFFRVNHIMMEPISPLHAYSNKRNIKLSIKNLIANKAIVVSNSLAGQQYWQKKSVKESLLIRNGFDINDIKYVERYMPVELRDFLNKSKYLVVSSRLSKTAIHKRIDLVLDMFSCLINHTEEYKLVICGDGPMRKHYELLASKYNINSSVYFTGFIKRETLWSLFHEASLFISLSEYEGMPNSVLEAAFCCTPLFLSKITNHTEVIPEEMACYVDNYNSEHLAGKLIKYLQNPLKYHRNSSELYEYSLKYSTENMIKKYIDLYNKIKSLR